MLAMRSRMVSRSLASCWNWAKRSFKPVSSRRSTLPFSSSAIWCSSSLLRLRTLGSFCVPSSIWRKSSNRVSRRDSVPTKERSVRLETQVMAFSVAGVRSKCGSSVPCG